MPCQDGLCTSGGRASAFTREAARGGRVTHCGATFPPLPPEGPPYVAPDLYHDYSTSVRVNEAEISVLASAVFAALLQQGYVRPRVPERQIVDRIRALLADNLRTEQELEEEAEREAEKHARQMVGLDQRTVIQGIKARLAKKRGFQL